MLRWTIVEDVTKNKEINQCKANNQCNVILLIIFYMQKQSTNIILHIEAEMAINSAKCIFVLVILQIY